MGIRDYLSSLQRNRNRNPGKHGERGTPQTKHEQNKRENHNSTKGGNKGKTTTETRARPRETRQTEEHAGEDKRATRRHTGRKRGSTCQAAERQQNGPGDDETTGFYEEQNRKRDPGQTALIF